MTSITTVTTNERANDAADCLLAWVLGLMSQRGAPFALQALADMQAGHAHVTVACDLAGGGAVLACQLSRGAELVPLGAAVVRMGIAPEHMN